MTDFSEIVEIANFIRERLDTYIAHVEHNIPSLSLIGTFSPRDLTDGTEFIPAEHNYQETLERTERVLKDIEKISKEALNSHDYMHFLQEKDDEVDRRITEKRFQFINIMIQKIAYTNNIDQLKKLASCIPKQDFSTDSKPSLTHLSANETDIQNLNVIIQNIFDEILPAYKDLKKKPSYKLYKSEENPILKAFHGLSALSIISPMPILGFAQNAEHSNVIMKLIHDTVIAPDFQEIQDNVQEFCYQHLLYIARNMKRYAKQTRQHLDDQATFQQITAQDFAELTDLLNGTPVLDVDIESLTQKFETARYNFNIVLETADIPAPEQFEDLAERAKALANNLLYTEHLCHPPPQPNS